MLPYDTRFVDRESDAAASREERLNRRAEQDKERTMQQQQPSSLPSSSMNNRRPSLSAQHEMPAPLDPRLSASDDFAKSGKEEQAHFHPATNEESEQSRSAPRPRALDASESGVAFHPDFSAFTESSLSTNTRSPKQLQQLHMYSDPVAETTHLTQNRFKEPLLAGDSKDSSASHSRKTSMTDADWNKTLATERSSGISHPSSHSQSMDVPSAVTGI